MRKEKNANCNMNFDQYKDDYNKVLQDSVGFINQKVDFYTEAKAIQIIDIAEKWFKDSHLLKILDIGCGVGTLDQYLCSHFQSLHGVDISAGLIEAAKKANPTVQYQTYDGNRMPYADESFDVVFTVCVLHHVEPKNRHHFFNEMKRVTKKGGMSLVFEHNPYNPLTRLVVYKCPFDENVILLRMSGVTQLFTQTQWKVINKKYFLFFPWKIKFLKNIEKALSWLPLGAQYWVGAMKE